MKLLTETKPLKAALTSLATFVPKRPTIPCLSHVLLSLGGNPPELQITGTDLDLWASVDLDAEVEQEEHVLVGLKSLRDALKPLKAGEVELESFKDTLNIGSVKLPLLPVEDYPLKPKHEGVIHESSPYTLDRLKKALIACTPDDSRYYLSAIHVTPFRLESTDGHRLMTVEAESKCVGSFLVPQPMAKLIARLKEDFSFRFSDNHVAADIGPWELIHRREDAQFPNASKVIPKNKQSLTFNRIALLEALQGLLPFTNEYSNAVRFEVGDNGSLHLESTNKEKGSSSAEVKAEISGKPIAIGFNASYLIDPLKVSQAEEIEFTWKDDANPATLKAEDWLYVIMPMRL